VPQLATLRETPQLSSAVTGPQVLPSREQNVAFDSGMQAHVLVAPHVCGSVQVPQLDTVRVAPQLSGAVTVPHVAPSREQNAASLSAEQPHTFEAPHVCGAVQLPHETVRIAPQTSGAVTAPQFLPSRAQNAASVSVAAQPHTFEAPHVCGMVQKPHVVVRIAPQLSAAVTEPQFLPSRAQNGASLSGVHAPHWPLALHVCVAGQAPHESVRAFPQRSVAMNGPQARPAAAQRSASVSGTHAVHTPTLQA
jgi:hypothetical protein